MTLVPVLSALNEALVLHIPYCWVTPIRFTRRRSRRLYLFIPSSLFKKHGNLCIKSESASVLISRARKKEVMQDIKPYEKSLMLPILDNYDISLRDFPHQIIRFLMTWSNIIHNQCRWKRLPNDRVLFSHVFDPYYQNLYSSDAKRSALHQSAYRGIEYTSA